MVPNKFKDDDYFDFIEKIEKQGFSPLGTGGFRQTYVRKNVVIKIPFNQDGVYDNITEARAWHLYKNKSTKNGLSLAPCRLLKNQALMMMKVDTDFKYNHPLPQWASNVDAGQVGLYKGKVVAYDYALDIKERLKWDKEWDDESFFRRSSFSTRLK